MVLPLIAGSPRRPGFDCLRRPAKRLARLDPSIGGSGPHAFAVRIDAARLAGQHVHRIPHPTFVTIAKRPSQRRRDGGYIQLICASGKAKYFLTRGLTRILKIRASCSHQRTPLKHASQWQHRARKGLRTRTCPALPGARTDRLPTAESKSYRVSHYRPAKERLGPKAYHSRIDPR